MKPIYTDIHIHTSENPDSLNLGYDIHTLFANIRQKAEGAHVLISFTDHNTINKKVYLDALSMCGNDIHLLLGVELHIHYIQETEAYHCHMFFKNNITAEEIDKINTILNTLYPKKSIPKTDPDIPTLNKLISEFDAYDFALLPHGGQSHATFNKAIPKAKRFDTMMERSVYYNQFDGFTARSESGREETDEYFRRLGISEFVNLVTCSDNYTPNTYPSAKADTAEPFIPTWMYAEPTFEGFRLSLSEKSRLVYAEHKPEAWSENIESVRCDNEKLDVDVQFGSGLNVVIGGSSSGKTLLVDSIYRHLTQSGFEQSVYNSFGVSDMTIVNPSGKHPHFLSQNYIMTVVNKQGTQDIGTIDILRSLFPDNREVVRLVNNSLTILKNDITELIQTVEEIEKIENVFKTTSQIGRLLVFEKIEKNVIAGILPKDNERQNIQYETSVKNQHVKSLKEIQTILSQNPLVSEGEEYVDKLVELLNRAYQYSELDGHVFQIINTAYSNYAEKLKSDSYETQTKAQEFSKLISNISEYVYQCRKFKAKLDAIAGYNYHVETQEIISAGHHLYISNKFELNKDKVLEVFKGLLKSDVRIDSFDDIQPNVLYENNFRKRGPKVENYHDFITHVSRCFEALNKTEYKITTKEGLQYDNLSAGWKTSVLLDLILGYDADNAPIIIDQPEDNLATKYINEGLVKAIKKVKYRKQIILVSHNATIPMMGDAQCVIYCENKGDKIYIRSAPLEGEIDGKPVLDLIATITDGGKSSIKKRVKKYNLKKFTE